MMEDLKNIIESFLFVAETPLTVERIKQIISGETKDIRNALEALKDEYEARKGGFILREVAGGYQVRTRPEYTEWIKRLLQPTPPRFSKAAMETLAIIAYKQPVIRSEIEHIRGVDCGGILRVLLERKLVRILGRKEIPGRPLIYATTKQFLEMFDLKGLKDLPTPKEIEDFGKTSTELVTDATFSGGLDETAETAADDTSETTDTLSADIDPPADTVAGDTDETAGGESDKNLKPKPDKSPERNGE